LSLILLIKLVLLGNCFKLFSFKNSTNALLKATTSGEVAKSVNPLHLIKSLDEGVLPPFLWLMKTTG